MHSLIVGFGSIGKQHFDVLKNVLGNNNVFVLSRREHNQKNFVTSLSHIDLKKFNYFVIANEANLHLEWLEKIKHLNAKILIEKPLSDKKIVFDVNKNYNNINIGYFMRLHPLVNKIKEIKISEISKVEFVNHSWLPDWRKNREFTKSVSANKELGGGVLNELSHDLDLAMFIYGSYELSTSHLSRNPKLKLNVFDTFEGDAKVLNSEIKLKFSLSMAKKKNEKYLKIFTKDNCYKADFINNSFLSKGTEEKLSNYLSSKKHLLQTQHETILSKEKNYLSTFEEGTWIANLIDSIERNNE